MNENIYYHPEKFGLREFGQLELGGGFEFDKFVVWVDANYNPTPLYGLIFLPVVYWAYDQGCSCPVPFEGHTWDDIGRGSAQQCMAALQLWYAGQYEYRKDQNAYVAFLERLITL